MVMNLWLVLLYFLSPFIEISYWKSTEFLSRMSWKLHPIKSNSLKSMRKWLSFSIFNIKVVLVKIPNVILKGILHEIRSPPFSYEENHCISGYYWVYTDLTTYRAVYGDRAAARYPRTIHCADTQFHSQPCWSDIMKLPLCSPTGNISKSY